MAYQDKWATIFLLLDSWSSYANVGEVRAALQSALPGWVLDADDSFTSTVTPVLSGPAAGEVAAGPWKGRPLTLATADSEGKWTGPTLVYRTAFKVNVSPADGSAVSEATLGDALRRVRTVALPKLRSGGFNNNQVGVKSYGKPLIADVGYPATPQLPAPLVPPEEPKSLLWLWLVLGAGAGYYLWERTPRRNYRRVSPKA
jgi:hypothetical protein